MVKELTNHTCIMKPPQKPQKCRVQGVLSLVNTLGDRESGVFAESMKLWAVSPSLALGIFYNKPVI